MQRLLIDNYHPERKLIINASIEILLNELSEEDQTIFILKEYYGYRYEEISNIVSMPVPTIKTRMFRMKKKLLQTAGGDDF
ncbi:RNA polymerase sigma factor [Ornithinibacillus scapharcae]|uniref:RNA polymerase sigma factor n=1 Tax=Ornithinibacillus scapharcae TaxID=1147159 RepID=UPI000225B083|nr:sigma factor-like helix-turn-helix DNA-binding protein [Ornithinibacillus scapharcae]